MQGRIIKWDDEKGFGFIKSPEVSENIFVHVSSFKEKRLRPSVGDDVEFEVKQTSKGLQAKKIIYPNQPKQLLTTPSSARHNASNSSNAIFSTLIKLIVLAGIVFGGYYFYQQYQKDKTLDELATPVYSSNSSQPITSQSVAAETNHNFKCDGRQYCSQMNSLEEAKFFIKNCPNTKMDGNNDGEPCESDTRWH